MHAVFFLFFFKDDLVFKPCLPVSKPFPHLFSIQTGFQAVQTQVPTFIVVHQLHLLVL